MKTQYSGRSQFAQKSGRARFNFVNRRNVVWKRRSGNAEGFNKSYFRNFNTPFYSKIDKFYRNFNTPFYNNIDKFYRNFNTPFYSNIDKFYTETLTRPSNSNIDSNVDNFFSGYDHVGTKSKWSVSAKGTDELIITLLCMCTNCHL